MSVAMQHNGGNGQLWFCVRTLAKHEHTAAGTLRRELNIDCFSPRVRFRKMTRRGPVWFVDAMFPGYIFAHFTYSELHRRVVHSAGVSTIVHFGDYVPHLEDAAIELLRKTAADDEVVTLDPQITPGTAVKVTDGPFQGLAAVVTQVIPARDRVRILLEFLGRQMETEMRSARLIPIRRPSTP